MSHALVVGGTGMLREATLSIAAHHDIVSVVARDEGRLVDLIDEGTGRGVKIMPWSVDYLVKSRLRETIDGARAATTTLGALMVSSGFVDSYKGLAFKG